MNSVDKEGVLVLCFFFLFKCSRAEYDQPT